MKETESGLCVEKGDERCRFLAPFPGFCAGAFMMLKKYGDPDDENRVHPAVAIGGCVVSVGVPLLLVIPGAPAFMAVQFFVALLVWVLMGVVFYFWSRRHFMKVSKREMDFLVLGNVQVVRGMRKDADREAVLQGKLINRTDE